MAPIGSNDSSRKAWRGEHKGLPLGLPIIFELEEGRMWLSIVLPRWLNEAIKSPLISGGLSQQGSKGDERVTQACFIAQIIKLNNIK
jgi:hypothetical protein